MPEVERERHLLANIAGILSFDSIAQGTRVVAMLSRMPNGNRAAPVTVIGASDCVVGCDVVVGQPAPQGIAAYEIPGVCRVVFDGRIDSSLESAGFFRGDGQPCARLVAEGYVKYGLEFLRLLEGDFAFGVFDVQSKKLLLGHDRMGARTLYWGRDGQSIAFGSLPVAVLEGTNLRFEASRYHIARAIASIGLTEDVGPYGNVNTVCSGKIVEFSRGGVGYIEVGNGSFDYEKIASAELVDEYRAELLASVKNRMASSGRPLAASLSGGLDSSAILGTCILGAQSAREVRAFSVLPGGSAAADIEFAAEVVKLTGCPWIQVPRTFDNFDDKFVGAAIDPFLASTSILALELFGCAKSYGLSQIMMGSLGDIVSGAAFDWRWATLREDGFRALSMALKESGVRPYYRARGAMNLALQLRLGHAIPRALSAVLRRDKLGDLLQQVSLIGSSQWGRLALFQEQLLFREALYRSRLTYSRQVGWMIDRFGWLELALWGYAGRYVGIEPLHPLATPQLARLAGLAPLALRAKGGRTRLLLRQAAEAWLPRSVVERTEKHYLTDYFQENWRRLIAGHVGGSTHQGVDLVNWRYWSKLAAEYGGLSTAVARTVYQCLVLDRWLRLNVDQDRNN